MSKFLFIVQGEGRGHLTQAISLSQLLREAGHEVTGVLVGVGEGRVIPSFFGEQINASVQPFLSPNLVFKNNRISFLATMTHHLPKAKRFSESLTLIHNTIQTQRPDVIINFYEMLGGIYSWLYRPQVPIVCVGHHYLFLHNQFQFPKKQWLERWLLQLNTKITAIGAEKLLALSFRPMPDQPNQSVVVTPPLLRREVAEVPVSQADFVLAYVNYASMSERIVEWHQQHPDVRIHCFWDNADYPDVYHYDDTLTFHRVNGQKYLRMMAQCRALVTTAGFESVCEAMYLGKPTMMVPAHYEQACNALDAQTAGAGIAAPTFDLSILMDYLPTHCPVQNEFRAWYAQAKSIIVSQLEQTARSKSQVYTLRTRYTGELLRRIAF